MSTGTLVLTKQAEQTISSPAYLPGSLICEYFVLSFALWTIATNATTFAGGTLRHLLILFILVGFLVLGWRWLGRRKRAQEHLEHERQAERLEKRERQVQTILLWLLVLVAVVLTMVAHRPDPDDDRYINRAVSVIDDPNLPILQYDSRHSVRLPIEPPTTRVVSLEMLAATLSWLTGVPPIYFFHLLFPPLAAALCILAYGELFKIFAPKHWVFGVLAVIIFLIANGEMHRTYGNFSFVRLHQGKAILVSVLVPLLITYGLRFASYPTRRNWLLLAGAQITAIGMTPTGLMVAPAVASLAVFTGVLGLSITALVKRLSLSLAASAYIIIIGLYIKLSSMLGLYEVPLSSNQFFEANVETVFGYGRFALVCLFVVLTAWFWCETQIARRFCLVFPIAIAVFFANPLAADIVAKYFAMNVYWRVFWILPLPAMAGLTLLAPLSSQKFHLNSWMRYALYILLLVLLLGVFSELHIFSRENQVSMMIPGLKVPPEYQIAQAINDAFEDRPNVLVPESVSVWLPTMHYHPYPVLSRLMHAYQFGYQGHERMALKSYIMGLERPDQAPDFLREGLQRYQIQGVSIPLSNPWAEEIRKVLEESGFKKYQTLLSNEIWIIQKH